MKRFAVFTLLAIFLAPGAYADFNTGVAAYARGEYETAAQHLIPLAETADDAYAQRFLAEMYAKGQGVEQNLELAAKWYRSAAEKGVAAAQYKLGIMYRDGQGVPKDMEYAYAWLSVANKLGSSQAPAALTAVEQNLSADEVGEAKKLSEEFIKKYGEPPKLKPEGFDQPIKQQ